jgi:hypothetical protein
LNLLIRGSSGIFLSYAKSKTMKNIHKVLSVLSLIILPVASYASSAERGTIHAVKDSAEAMYGNAPDMIFDQSMDKLSTLPESTIEYLLESQNRSQVDEILSMVDDVRASN